MSSAGTTSRGLSVRSLVMLTSLDFKGLLGQTSLSHFTCMSEYLMDILGLSGQLAILCMSEYP